MSSRDGFDGAAKDWNDAYVQGFDALSAVDKEWSRANDYHSCPPGLKPVDLDAFLALELKARVLILAGLLHERSVNMFYAWRGVGKTWFALSLAYAIAVGGTFLRWKADKARRVLYIDGEMPAIALRERILPIIAGYGDMKPADGYFQFLPADLHELGLPNLATPEGQTAVDKVIGNAEVIIFDNVSTLFMSGRENEAESWQPVQAWLLKLRREGRTVIIIHHAGKGKAQRGTSRREDILDIVLNLRHSDDYDRSQGCCFEIHFEKSRGMSGGEATQPFEAKLEIREGKGEWTMRDLEDARSVEIAELKAEGKSVREIAKDLGMSKSAVQRALAKKQTK